MTNLGTLGGASSFATQTSADGAVVVGRSGTAGGVNHAFRWSGGIMTDLGTFGGTGSAAYGMSADGAVVVGSARIAGKPETHAFRWSGGVMADLGTLGGTFSTAYGVSADGAVVIGRATAAGDVERRPLPLERRHHDQSRHVRWHLRQRPWRVGQRRCRRGIFLPHRRYRSRTCLPLERRRGRPIFGTLGGTSSAGIAVSADGSVVVGNSQITGDTEQRAFRWKAATGMQSIATLLTASGVNITGWQLTNANGVSADGTVIVGNGTNPSGNAEAWITRCTTSCAMITP